MFINFIELPLHFYELLLVVVFVVGYLIIALEHPLKFNKAATAILMAVLMWIVYRYALPYLEPNADAVSTTNERIMHAVGEISQMILLLLGAITIVQIIDFHGGFTYIASAIQTRNKRKLLWIVCTFSFVLSAVLDNMTTTIVMVMLLRRIVAERDLRLFYAGFVVIAANAGGAFSPIGDVTTIMLWVNNNVSATGIIPAIFLPSLVSIVVPLLIASPFLKGKVTESKEISLTVEEERLVKLQNEMKSKEKLTVLILGVSMLILTPILKSITHLPPFLFMIGGMGLLWAYTEIFYKHRSGEIKESLMQRVSQVIQTVDHSTLLFFFGILMAVKTLELSGLLNSVAQHMEVLGLEAQSFFIGVASSIVDNVPLVAAAMGMYKIDPHSTLLCMDGEFWDLIAYCAGTGGSLLIIGSAAGVIMMGLEKVSFGWYLKKITPLALIGYVVGFFTLVIQAHLLR